MDEGAPAAPPPQETKSPSRKGSTTKKVGMLSYRSNFYRSVPKAEKQGLRTAARMDSVKEGNKFAGGVQEDFARSQSKDSKATAQPAKRAAELKSTFRGGVTEDFVRSQQRVNGASPPGGRAKRGGEMAAPYTGGFAERLARDQQTLKHAQATSGNAVGGAKRGGEMRGAKGGGAYDGGLLRSTSPTKPLSSHGSSPRRGPHASYSMHRLACTAYSMHRV